MKKCSKCKINKNIGKFGNNKIAKDGLRYVCKQCENFYQKIYSKNHKEKIKAYRETHKDEYRIYLATHKKEMRGYRKVYRETHVNEIKAHIKAYREAHRDERRIYHNNRLRTNLQYKLARCLRTRLHMAIKRNYKSGSAVKDLGCTIPELIIHLEKQFTSGMNWQNQGQWHIDHIIPLSSFDLTDRKQLLKACHYTNLQPLWAIDNIIKGDKILSLDNAPLSVV